MPPPSTAHATVRLLGNKNMNNWLSFFSIIAVQGVALFVIEWHERSFSRNDRHAHSIKSALVASLLGGVAFGIFFDVILGGRLGFFNYYLDAHVFQILNALFSYGIAIFTALQFSPRPVSAHDSTTLKAVIPLVALFVVVIVLYLITPNPIAFMFVVGGTIVVGGELFECYFFGTLGPFLEALSGRIMRVFRNWLTVISIGVTYEAANAIFPVWLWTFNGTEATAFNELLIIVFGYPVLFHAARLIGLAALKLIED
jgi:hypothetical protein